MTGPEHARAAADLVQQAATAHVSTPADLRAEATVHALLAVVAALTQLAAGRTPHDQEQWRDVFSPAAAAPAGHPVDEYRRGLRDAAALVHGFLISTAAGDGDAVAVLGRVQEALERQAAASHPWR